MKNLYFFVATIMATAISAQNIEFTNVNFKKNLLEPGLIPTIQDLDGNNTTIDTNDDGEINIAEAKNISVLRFSDVNFTDVNGLEHFTNLKNLMLANVRVREIDLSPFPDLEQLELQNNRLSEIDLSTNTKLTYLSLSTNYNITSIDVTKNTELIELWLTNTPISKIDISNNTKLEKFICSGAKNISELNVTPLKNLTLLWCSENKLTSLDVSQNTKLTSLYIANNQISKIDLSKNINLSSLKCYDNLLNDLDLSKNSKLTIGLSNQNLLCQENPNLETINLKNNHIESTDVLKMNFNDCPKLKHICADTDEIAALKTVADGYGYTDLTIDDTCGSDLSNDEFPFNQEFSLYPNPVENQLQIQTKNGVSVKAIHIFNPQGQNVLQTKQTTIDVSQLNAGLYIVKILTDKGTTTTKFVKV